MTAMAKIQKCKHCGKAMSDEDVAFGYDGVCPKCVFDEIWGCCNHDKKMPFISVERNQSPEFIPSPRMTIATAALQGLLASGMTNNSNEFMAQKAVDLADALLNRLSEPKDGVQG
jgi:hypothetical protein